MGHLLCKQRSGHTPGSGKRWKKRGDCFLRGPCLLCFIVHNNNNHSKQRDPPPPPPPPQIPAAQHRAPRLLLLLCPGELRAWEEQRLLCTVTSPRGGNPAAPDMVCKRKGGGQQPPRTPPCKQPRCGPAAGEPSCCSPPASVSPPCTPAPPSPPELCCCAEAEPRPQEAAGEGAEACEPINQLPPSLLLKIFSNLSLNERCLSASLVCKYWCDLCLDFQFWKQLDLSGRQQVTDCVLKKIASRCQNITEINISDCRDVSDTGVCMVALRCPGLLKYTAYRCKQLSDTSLMALATQCSSLQKVHVGNQDRLTDEGLKQLGTKCRQLKDIHFGQCYKISDEGMIIIAKGSPKLQRIYMQENKLVSDESVKAFAEHCPELQYVGFMGCSVTSKGVIHLTNLRHLSSLDLRHITELDNDTVMEVVKRCRSLTSLNLCLNWSINDRHASVAWNQVLLTSFFLAFFSYAAVLLHSMPAMSPLKGVLRCEIKLFPIDTNKLLAVFEDPD
ncbi:F-box/LRR-repeat protein 17 isoform X2 [Ascaphus truei]|uniref:F-box/LRR-repeat protein 17 isoform X2 n=1 Tax=Ascaphus truei TaxID=8439 RepID=UPI003F59B5A1